MPPARESASSQTTATVTVNAASVSATVPPEGYGLNTYVFDGNMLSTGVATAVQSSGVTALRYPGGSDSDVFNFIAGTQQSMNDGDYWNSDDTFANFVSQLAQPEGGTPIITVNYGSNVANNGPALPSEALLGLVRQRQQQLRNRLLGDRQRDLRQRLLQQLGLGVRSA